MIKIEELTETECRELIQKIDGIVANFPSFIEYNEESGYADHYSCCSAYIINNCDHAEDCTIGQLKNLFEY